MVSKVPFLSGRPPQLLVALVMKMRLQLYSPGDYVVHEGEVGCDMYFLAGGCSPDLC